MKTRSSTEGFYRNLNLVGRVKCWVQLSSENIARSSLPKLRSVDAKPNQSIRGALKSSTIIKCVVDGSLTTSRRNSNGAESSISSDEGERYTTTRRRHSVASMENLRLSAPMVVGRVG